MNGMLVVVRIGTKWLSLNALHTFEATGRHVHMARAAQELNVSQSAVSHQIRKLEASLGTRLFERHGRRIALTQDGQALLLTVQQALSSITATCAQLGDDAFAGELSIASPASFATQWLMPRLPQFLSAFPDLTLRREVVQRDGEASALDVDVAILFDEPRSPGRRGVTLVDLELFPVCAPSCVKHPLPLDTSVLRTETLIHEDKGELWARWFVATGTEQFQPRRHIYAGTNHEANALACAGLGFAINDQFMGADALKNGKLIRPFGKASIQFGQYHLLTAAPEQMTEPALEFERWLMRQLG